MLLEVPIPKTAGARPPNYGGPPICTTFSNSPDDRDDMIVTLRDNISRLVGQAKRADTSAASTFLRLLDQRRDWIKGELDVEGMLNEPPSAPLGIADNRYDLRTLSIEPVDDRRKVYEGMISMIDVTMADLWERMLSSEESAE